MNTRPLSFWNLYRTANVPTRAKLNASREMKAIVLKHGKMDKTLTVSLCFSTKIKIMNSVKLFGDFG